MSKSLAETLDEFDDFVEVVYGPIDEELIETYLKEYGGNLEGYRKYRKHKQRPGQAFFNALPLFQQYMIRGSYRDPFYTEDPAKIEECIEWLMYRK